MCGRFQKGVAHAKRVGTTTLVRLKYKAELREKRSVLALAWEDRKPNHQLKEIVTMILRGHDSRKGD